MPTTPSNYEASESRSALWISDPNVFALLDRCDPYDVPTALDGPFYLFRNRYYLDHESVRTVANWITENNWHMPQEPAYAFDVRNIPNGMYHVTVGHNLDCDYQIYTVKQGRWAGRRVIKTNIDGTYKAFAFLNADGSWTLWSRFRSQADQFFVQTTPDFLRLVGEMFVSRSGIMPPGTEQFGTLSDSEDGISVEVRTTSCRVCNDTLNYYTNVTQCCSTHEPEDYNGRISAFGGYVPSRGSTEPWSLDDRSIPLPMCEVRGMDVQ